jgi:F-type H+-transporting ATPase subunit b
VDINATLLGQMITFAIFVWITMKFVWPHLEKALETRRAKIADGLAAADQGHRDLLSSNQKAQQAMETAKIEALKIVEGAHLQAQHIVAQSKAQAFVEGQRLIEKAQAEIVQQTQQAREQLRTEVVRIALLGAEKILEKNIDDDQGRLILDNFIKEV